MTFSRSSINLQVGNLPNCTTLDSWGFDNFIIVDKPFGKTIQIFESCVLKFCKSLKFLMKGHVHYILVGLFF